jgi:hypothetical protein
MPNLFPIETPDGAGWLHPGGRRWFPVLAGYAQVPNVAILLSRPLNIRGNARVIATSQHDQRHLFRKAAIGGVFLCVVELRQLEELLRQLAYPSVVTHESAFRAQEMLS